MWTMYTMDDLYLSDESDFYGDEKTKKALQRRVQNFSVAHYLKGLDEHPTPRRKLLRETRKQKQKEAGKMYNPYEGVPLAWQLGQPLEEFFDKYMPSKTPASLGPWIWMANPYAGRKEKTGDDLHPVDAINEAAGALHTLSQQLEEIKKLKVASAEKPALKDQSLREAQEAILRAGRKYNLTTGKWMLFPSLTTCDSTWNKVARATNAGKLGVACKIATRDDSGKFPVLCVYTKDMMDKEDVKRVLFELKGLGVIREKQRYYYKPDIYTHLALNSGNKYGITPWIYSSEQMLKNSD